MKRNHYMYKTQGESEENKMGHKPGEIIELRDGKVAVVEKYWDENESSLWCDIDTGKYIVKVTDVLPEPPENPPQWALDARYAILETERKRQVLEALTPDQFILLSNGVVTRVKQVKANVILTETETGTGCYNYPIDWFVRVVTVFAKIT